MQRDPRAFLWDVRESALAIQSFTTGMDLDAYAAKAMAQAAVEPVLLRGRLGAIFQIADCAYKSRATSLFCTSFNGQLNSKLCLPLPSFSVSSCACGTTTIRRPYPCGIPGI